MIYLDDFCFQMLVAYSVYEMTFELCRDEWGTAWEGDIGMGQRVLVGDGDSCSGDGVGMGI